MRKLLLFILVIILVTITLSGCSSTGTSINQKTEEELRAEIKAELEAEQKKIAEIEAKIRAELEAEQKEKEQKEKEQEESIKETDKKDETSDAQEKEVAPIVLSTSMTKDEIINKLGNNYTFETKEDGGYFNYYSVLTYDDIVFTFYHDNKEVGNVKPDNINITSNKYTYGYGFKIGDPALKAFEYCEKNFENVLDHHNNVHIFDCFLYKQKSNSEKMENTGFNIAWTYDTGKAYESKSEINNDVKIKSVSLFYFLD